MIFTPSLKPKLIYVFRINDEAHSGCLKVGETTCDCDNAHTLRPNCSALNQAAKKRINQYTQTAGIAYDLLHTEITLYDADSVSRSFSDKDVHKVLIRSGIEKKTFDIEHNANEWFITDLETVKRAIAAVREGRQSLLSAEISHDRSPIVFRPEQREAIDKTKKRFKRGDRMLWNAKMRFGKTLSALQMVKEMRFARTLILTHRPVVDGGWFEDFRKIFHDATDYAYGSKNNGDAHQSLETRAKQGACRYVYFASIQDLRGSELVGGNFDKNHEVFATPWDCIIVDEAHEGTQTQLGKAVMTQLTKPNTKILQLSGTPFNLLDDFKDEEVYTWDYVMEQRAKAEWDRIHFGDPNPYASLPAMNIYTYDLARLLDEFSDEDVAFNFREFFRVDREGNFVHRNDVASFLNLITKEDEESRYPFANQTYRNIFRHTFWLVPGVKEARALSAMMQAHPVFQQFKIVNVAGDGDAEDDNKEALNAVRDAIGANPDDTYTITLSCGRLTTGVSVGAWTAVFMLSGSYHTAASSYMQTIFRVQTPATINGRVKEQCYVFDFAPDRTLQVIAETAKISAKAGKTNNGDRAIMGEFLNFCPVIAIEGSQMCRFDVPRMLEQLKRVYVERAVRNGFEDNCLYNDALSKLDDEELKGFDELKKIIGQTPAMHKTNQIDINNQGLTNEQYEELERLDQKSRKRQPLTDEEKQRLEQFKKKQENRQAAISILRGISIRMPLLIYGAELNDETREITIDNFTSLIDSQSWEEFMPKGVTKQRFNQFKKFYDPEIFCAAGKRIRALARAADRLSIERRIERITEIFGTFRNPDKETVLTPWRVVNMHLGDCLGGYNFFDDEYRTQLSDPRFIDRSKVTADVFDENSRILEINSKSGLYPLYMAYGIYRRRKAASLSPVSELSEQLGLWDKVVSENIFVICKTPMAKSITRRTLVGFRNAKVNTRYFEDLINQIKNKPENFIKKVAKGHSYWKANNDDNMKFNAIVGNPPYQIQNEGNGNGADPVYHHFIDISQKLGTKSTFIHPARFLFNAGKTPKDWNKKTLNNPNIKVVNYWSKSSDVFPNVDVKGGIAITFWDKHTHFGKIGFFSPYPELKSILNKIKNSDFITFSSLVGPREAYGITETLYEEHPDMEGRQSKGHKYSLSANIIDIFPELFSVEESSDSIQIYGRYDNKREYRYIKSSYISTPDNFNTYKVFVPEANGTGAIGEVLSTPIIGTPMIGHTDTFLSVGKFDTEKEAEACLKYIKSKFARTMLGTLKATQHNPRDTWANVPMQDFTEASDIDWNLPIEEIDRQLYRKYDLTAEEVAFIEKMIRPM